MNAESCATCRFSEIEYRYVVEVDALIGLSPDEASGETEPVMVCRRFPPVAMFRVDDSDLVPTIAQPPVGATEWCGEWGAVRDE